MALDPNKLWRRYTGRPVLTTPLESVVRFSRRGFIVGSSAAVLTAPRLLRAMTAQVSLRAYPEYVALLLDGVERCRFGSAALSGSPRLEVLRNLPDHIVIQLAGARYPGTRLSADVHCDVKKGVTGWDLDLRFLGGASRIRTDLLEWLEEHASIAASVAPGPVASLSADGALDLVRESSVSIGPDWSLCFRGKRAIRLIGVGPAIFGNEAHVRLMPAAENLSKEESGPATSIEVLRGRQTWSTVAGEMFRGAELRRRGEIFDRARVELREHDAKPTIVFLSSPPASELALAAHTALRDPEGHALRSKLRDPIYSVTLGSPRESVILANLAAEIEVHGEGFSARIGNPPDTPTVMVVAQGDDITCRAALAEVRSLPFPDLDGVIANLTVWNAARLPLWDFTDNTGANPDLVCAFDDDHARICLDNIVLSLLRPQDMLALNVRFKNLSLVQTDGQMFLVRSTAGDKPLCIAPGVARPACGADSANTAPSFLTFEFPPQSIAEECFLEENPAQGNQCGDVTTEKPAQPACTILSNGSCLVFCIPDDQLNGNGLPFTLESLLDWRRYHPSLHPNAWPVRDAQPTISEACNPGLPGAVTPPTPLHTRIEFPYRLLLSPHWLSGWIPSNTKLNSVDEDQQDRITASSELWHTLLGTMVKDDKRQPQVDPDNAQLRTVRAIWSRDFVSATKQPPEIFACKTSQPAPGCAAPPTNTPPKPPLRLPMNASDRLEIVHLSSNYSMATIGTDGAIPYDPLPVKLKHLALSSLGAWFDGVGQWEPPLPFPLSVPTNPAQCDCQTTLPTRHFNVEGWTHRASQARDHFVQVLYRGFLMPFGNRVALIKETQRFFYCQNEPSENVSNVCYLRQKFYIVVREPEKVYPAEGHVYKGRHSPFQRIEFQTLISPALDDPCLHTVGGLPSNNVFWPYVNGQPFYWNLKGYDWATPHESSVFRLPMLFVPNEYAYSPACLNVIRVEYTKAGEQRKELRQAILGGQEVHFAESEKSGDTKLKCSSMTFNVDVADPSPTGLAGDWRDFDPARAEYKVQPFFYPALEQAVVDIPAVQHVAGDGQAPVVQYPQRYLTHGFSPASSSTADGTLEPHNPGEAFLELVKKPENQRSLNFPGANGGGIVVPNISVSGVSRKLGAISGSTIEKVAKSEFDPSDFFKVIGDVDSLLNPKLLGVIPLGEVIAPLRDLRAAIEKVPKLVLEQLHDLTMWVVNALKTAAVQEFRRIMGAIDSNLLAFETKLADQLKNAFGGTAADVKFKALADGIRAGLEQAGDQLLKNLGLPPGSSVPPRPLVLTRFTVGGTLLEIRDKLLKDLLVLQAKGSQIAQADVDEIANTFTVFAELHIKLFREKFKDLSSRVETLYQEGLPTHPIAAATNDLISDFKDIEGLPQVPAKDVPTRIGDLAQRVPVHIRGLQGAIAQFAAALDRVRKNAARAFDPATIRSLVQQTISDFKSTFQAETAKLRKDLFALVDAVNAKVVQYQNPANYPQYKDAQAALKETQTKLAALRTEVDHNIAAFEKIANDTFDQVISQAIQTAVANVPDEVWTALATVLDIQASVNNLLTELAQPLEIKVNYDFDPQIQDAPSDSPIFIASQDSTSATFGIHFTLRKQLKPLNPQVGGLPEFTLSAALTNFSIRLLPSVHFFTLQFTRAEILVSGADHPKITVQLNKKNPIVFGDALSFIGGFVKAVENFGGDEKNGPFIRIEPWGVRAGYSFTAPTITAGGFNIYNLALGASVELSFENKPFRVRFHFAERAHPFIISSGIFGGGGYFLIDLGPDGVEMLEVSLEFGAYAQIDIALASGEVHILGGIYYSSDGHSCRLSGFVDVGGCVTVIGLITCTLDFYLGLSYTNDGTVEGECTVSVEISFAFFSITVHLTAHRTFHSGSNPQAASFTIDPLQPRALYSWEQPPVADAPAVIPMCQPLASIGTEDRWKKLYHSKFAEVA
jgi:hypothetical protein